MSAEDFEDVLIAVTLLDQDFFRHLIVRIHIVGVDAHIQLGDVNFAQFGEHRDGLVDST